MLTGRKFRIYPTKEQDAALSRWIGCQRVIRNAKIEETHYQTWLRRFSKFSDRPGDESEGYIFTHCYSQFVTEQNEWLREVPSQVLRNGVFRAKDAFVRYWSGVAKRPVSKGRGSEGSVMLTRELFRIEDGVLNIGTFRQPLGNIKWKTHRKFSPPSTLTISRSGEGLWYASFCCEDGVSVPSADDLLEQHSFAQEGQILALDAGVINPLSDSEGRFYHLEPKRLKRIDKLEKRRAKLQRKLSRQKKGSNNRRKTKKCLARIARKKNNLISDWRHQTTHRITAVPHSVIVMEDLNLSNMTRKAKPKENPAASAPGQPDYLSNGGSAKSGLNKALLNVGLGEISTLVQYKARRTRKAFMFVPAHHSSQECSQCTHISPDNRPTQAEFNCQACGYQAHADYNASLVLRKRGHSLLITDRPVGTRGRKMPARKRIKLLPATGKKPPSNASRIGGR